MSYKPRIWEIDSQTGVKMNLYVGNLSSDVNDSDLRQAFEVYGNVASAAIIKDRFSGDSRGFGFVDMPSKEEALEAIRELNGQEIKGQSLIVSEAKPKRDSNRGGGGGGGGKRRSGGYGGGGYGGGGGNRRW